MQIANRKVVTIDYTLTNEKGEVLDSSKGQEPLSYIHGSGSIIPGLEAALEGKSAGEQLKVTIAPDDGYGDRDEGLVQEIPRNRFPIPDVEVGMQFQAQGAGESRVVTVVGVDGDKVKVDANHPLAGVTLAFDVTVVEVRDATADELTHGHVHGPGGHDH
jgi:FKBP-type peptidyl-prolyl cis-trans isomerase SlyD